MIISVCVSGFSFFFFFHEIDQRRSYSKEVHPLKAWVGPSIVKRRRRWSGQESKVSVGRGHKQLKFISRGEDSSWKRVPVVYSKIEQVCFQLPFNKQINSPKLQTAYRVLEKLHLFLQFEFKITRLNFTIESLGELFSVIHTYVRYIYFTGQPGPIAIFSTRIYFPSGVNSTLLTYNKNYS